MAIFGQRNSFTCGALGYFAGRLAERGFVSLAVTNGPALVAGSGSTKPVYCTNPMAFAAPQVGGPPLLIDQSSSATAFVNMVDGKWYSTVWTAGAIPQPDVLGRSSRPVFLPLWAPLVLPANPQIRLQTGHREHLEHLGVQVE